MMFAGLLFKNSKQVQWTALIGIFILVGVAIFDNQLISTQGSKSYFNMIELNSFTSWFNVLITSCAAVYFLLFHKQIAGVGIKKAEYFALMFFILSGVYLLSSYSN